MVLLIKKHSVINKGDYTLSTVVLLVLLTMFSCSNAIKETTYFVSVSGNNQNIGSKTEPFATLEKALAVIAERRKNGDTSFLKIIISKGTYSIKNTFYIDKSLSNISIETNEHDKVVFTGGKSIPVTLIEVNPDKNKRLKRCLVDLRKSGITDYGKISNVGFARPYQIIWGELFLNDRPMHLARYPNKGMIPMGSVLDAGSIPRNNDFSNRGGVIRYDSLRINKWAKQKDIWMAGYFKWGYADDMVKIASIDTVEQTIKTASPTLYGFGNGMPVQKWYGVNVFSELDDDGEYYLDRNRGIIHFVTAADTIKSLDFSILQSPFFNIEGTANFSISGITFKCSRGIGIALCNSENVLIKDCVFMNLGSLGITVGKGIEPFKEYRHDGTGKSKSGILGNLNEHLYAHSTFNREGGINNKIRGCLFYNLGAGGVSLGGGNRLTLKRGNNQVENCRFYNINRIEKSYRPAVALYGVGNIISHCEISNTPSMAILMHGNNHTIEYNYFHDVCLDADDQGAIYYGRDPSELGSVIRYNYFENIPDVRNTCAVYHDDGACGTTVTCNVFFMAGKWNVLIGGGSYNTYTNNIFIETKFGIHVDNRLQNWAKKSLEKGGIFEQRLNAIKYRFPPYGLRYPFLKTYFREAALPTNNLFEKNVFVRVETPVDGNKEWLEFKNNFITNDDVGFTDYKKHIFSLRSTSVVFKKIPGFKPVEFSKTGLLKGYETKNR